MGERGLVQTAGEEKACPGPETRAEPPGVPVSKGQAGRRAWKLWMEQREKPQSVMSRKLQQGSVC